MQLLQNLQQLLQTERPIRKYKAKTLSDVEQDYLDSIKFLEQKADKK